MNRVQLIFYRLYNALPLLLAAALPVYAAAQDTPTFTRVQLTQMTYYPQRGLSEDLVQRELAAVTKNHNDVIDFSTVQDIASRITTLYRAAGFVFTRAYVPQQTSRDGVVEVRLLEGTLSSVDILNNQRYSAATLTQPFADLLGKVIYNPDMEEAITLLNDYPGLNVFGFYSVGEELGGTRLNLRVQQERRWSGALRTDNYGSELTGRIRTLGTVEAFNPTDRADHLRVSVLQTAAPHNATFGAFDYDLPVLDKRSQLTLRASADTFVVARGASDGTQLDISGKAQAIALEFKHQLKRSSADNRSWHIDLSRDSSRSDIKDFASSINLDQKTWQTDLGYSFDHLNRRQNALYSAAVDIVAGRYDSIDIPGQTRDYRLARGFISHSRGIAGGDTLQQIKFDIDWQYSRDVLPAADQYALTGANRLRGFVPGDFSADTGTIATLCWVFPRYALTKRTEKTEKTKNTTDPTNNSERQADVTLSLFAEYGYGVQNVPRGAHDDWGYMSDIGASWLFTFGPELSATASIAMPLAHRINYQDNHVTATRGWLELLWRFH